MNTRTISGAMGSSLARVVFCGLLALTAGCKRADENSHATENTKKIDSRTGHFGCTDSKQTARISMRPSSDSYMPWTMQIPKAYLGYSLNWEGGEQRMVRINTKYPSLEPRPSGTFWTSCAADTNQKDLTEWSPERLDIRITADSIVGTPLIGFRKPPDEYVEAESPVADLTHLQHKCMANLPTTPDPKIPMRDCAYEYWFVPKTQDADQPIVIQCSGALENPSASCAVHFSHNGHSVQYEFKRARLPDWRQFNAATLELLRRFTT